MRARPCPPCIGRYTNGRHTQSRLFSHASTYTTSQSCHLATARDSDTAVRVVRTRCGPRLQRHQSTLAQSATPPDRPCATATTSSTHMNLKKGNLVGDNCSKSMSCCNDHFLFWPSMCTAETDGRKAHTAPVSLRGHLKGPWSMCTMKSMLHEEGTQDAYISFCLTPHILGKMQPCIAIRTLTVKRKESFPKTAKIPFSFSHVSASNR